MRKSMLIFAIFFLGSWISCKIKNSNTNPNVSKPPIAYFDTLNTLKYNLAKGSSHLFYLALKGAGLDSLLTQKSAFYTLLIPSDSVFEAALLDSITIIGLDKISLQKILSNQIFPSNISDSVLSTTPGYIPFGSLSLLGISSNTFYFHKEPNGLWCHGRQFTSTSSGLKSSNGYIYFIKQFLAPPTLTPLLIVNSRPEFSYFAAAIHINDSIYNTINTTYSSSAFSVSFQNLIPYIGTYFIPTNQAFINAGFPTIQSIIKFEKRYQKIYSLPVANFYNFASTSLDSLIASCVVPGNLYFYFDIANISYIQNLYSNLLINYVDYPGSGQASGKAIPPYIGLIEINRSGISPTIGCNSVKNPPFGNIVIKDLVGAGCVIQGVDHLFWPY